MKTITVVAEDPVQSTVFLRAYCNSVSMSHQRHICIPNPFSTGNAIEWFKRFELRCKANNWDAEMQAIKLPMLLEGEALAIWLELSDEGEQKTYEIAKKAVVDGIMPMAFTSLEEFHQRKLHPGEHSQSTSTT